MAYSWSRKHLSPDTWTLASPPAAGTQRRETRGGGRRGKGRKRGGGVKEKEGEGEERGREKEGRERGYRKSYERGIDLVGDPLWGRLW